MKKRSLVVLCAVLAGAASCAQREAPSPACDCAPSARPVAAPVLAWLSQARSLHHLADSFEDDGAVQRALGSLTELVQAPRPAGNAPEIDEILADTFARMAEMQSRGGQYSEALGSIDRGLALAQSEGYFRGHLFEVRGLVLERQSQRLSKEGKTADAERARAEAIRASATAVRIQNLVVERTLGDAAGARDR